MSEAPEGDGWLHELKFDGYRILARLADGEATLASRRGNDWTAKFPGVRAAVEKLSVRDAILDGEVAVAGPDGRTSFQALQNALGGDGAGTVYYAFDLLWLDGEDLTGQPIEARKEALARLIKAAPRGLPLQYSDHVVGHGRRFFEQARARGLEGIISKKRGEPYRRGRSTDWLKTKAVTRQEFVIGGYTDPEGSRSGIGALLVGTYDADGKLAFAGKVGTGFTQKVLRDLQARLAPLEQKVCPFAVEPPRSWLGRPAHWVKPKLVGEVAFIEWTADGRLRHPSFQGLREDKKPESVVRERSAPTAAVTGRAEPTSDGEVDGEVGVESRVQRSGLSAPATKRAPAARSHAKAVVRPVSKRAARSASAPASNPGAGPAATARAKVAKVNAKTGAKVSAKSGAKSSPAAGAKPATAARPVGKGEAEVLGERISHPERVVYPQIGLTKLDVARYYEEVAESMLPHVAGRPLSLVRCPEGLTKPCFYMKHYPTNARPAALAQIAIREKTKTGSYLVVDDPQGLVALCQMGILEVHTWNSTRDHLEQPDRFVLDLDPGPEVKWALTVETAHLIRERLRSLGLASYVKTTGGKGLHVVVPLQPALDWDSCLNLSRAISALIEGERPRLYTLNLSKAGREDKILIDYLRNTRGATSVAAYSTRAKPGATVSVPLAWDELDAKLDPARFTLRSVPERLATLGADPWADYFRKPQKLPAPLLKLLKA